jgi:hypothetical protein
MASIVTKFDKIKKSKVKIRDSSKVLLKSAMISDLDQVKLNGIDLTISFNDRVEFPLNFKYYESPKGLLRNFLISNTFNYIKCDPTPTYLYSEIGGMPKRRNIGKIIIPLSSDPVITSYYYIYLRKGLGLLTDTFAYDLLRNGRVFVSEIGSKAISPVPVLMPKFYDDAIKRTFSFSKVYKYHFGDEQKGFVGSAPLNKLRFDCRHSNMFLPTSHRIKFNSILLPSQLESALEFVYLDEICRTENSLK